MRRRQRTKLIALSAFAGAAALSISLACGCSSFSSSPHGLGEDASGADGAEGADGATEDARPLSDGGPKGVVACNLEAGSQCIVPDEVCCLRHDDFYDLCIPHPSSTSGACPDVAGSTRIIECDDDTDCAAKPGTVCCVFSSTLYTISCAPPENCTAANNARACDRNATGVCEGGTTCKAYGDSPYYACMP